MFFCCTAVIFLFAIYQKYGIQQFVWYSTNDISGVHPATTLLSVISQHNTVKGRLLNLHIMSAGTRLSRCRRSRICMASASANGFACCLSLVSHPCAVGLQSNLCFHDCRYAQVSVNILVPDV